MEDEIMEPTIEIAEPTSTSDEWDEFGDHCCF
jgi:hypothetical protein